MSCKCIGCNNPCYQGFEYCGRTCGQGRCGHFKPQPTGPTCANPGCNRQRNPGHPYCGRTCASQATGRKNLRDAVQGERLCACSRCHRPCYPGHDYCGRTCGQGLCRH